MTPATGIDLRIGRLQALYRTGQLTPTQVIQQLLAARERSDPAIWIDRIPHGDVLARATTLQTDPAAAHLPLYGVPFAVKDNIDVAGRPTTAACPSFAYTATTSATVVRRLEAAGAILLGKTNLDQFATGLVGTRSPYGTPTNPLAPDHVPGGSSSGSAVAVAAGLVGFALGTDTAGSGRVPAAMTGTVGWKPSPGRVSTTGVVPACASLDTVSVFATTVADARTIATVLDAPDPTDPWSLPAHRRPPADWTASDACLAVPDELGLEPCDGPARHAFDQHMAVLRAHGLKITPIDFTPFATTADLLYDGPWVAERLTHLDARLDELPDVDPTVAQILTTARDLTAADAYRGLHSLQQLRRQVDDQFATIDVLVVPSVPTMPTLADVRDDPVRPNALLGTYTNFANLLDLTAVALPRGRRCDHLPVGITLLARAGNEYELLDVATELEAAT